MRKLEKILEENGISKEEIMDIVLDPEFDMQWNSETGKRFRKTIVDIVSCIRVEDRWIPVEERLPEEDGFYMTTMDGGIVGQEESFVGLAEFENGLWVDDDIDYKCIIAWRPLAEPYHQERSDGK